MKKNQKNEISMLFNIGESESELVQKLEKIMEKNLKKEKSFTKDLPIERINIDKMRH
jgi:hypothetical protein